MLVVFVVRPERHGEPVATLPEDLQGCGDALVAVDAHGPFFPLGEALETQPRLRDRLARALSPPSLARYRLVRPWLLLGLLPIVVLVELERELAAVGATGLGGRMVGDVLLGAFCALELARPVPRHPLACAAALASVAARYGYMLAASCRELPPLFWFGGIGALVACGAMLGLVPGTLRIQRELRERLALSPPAPAPSPSPSPSPSRAPILWALGGAALLPIALAIARAAGAGALGTGVLFLLLGGVLGAVLPRRLGLRLRALEPKPRPTALHAADTAFFGFATALALARLLHYTTIGVAAAVQCGAPHFWAARIAPLPTSAASPASPAIHGVVGQLALGLMVVLVVPVIEELLYRHTLQRALRARWPARRALGAASVAFGLAHLGVYRTEVFQTVLLGIGFGAAYEEAGLVAATVAHVLYNASQLL